MDLGLDSLLHGCVCPHFHSLLLPASSRAFLPLPASSRAFLRLSASSRRGLLGCARPWQLLLEREQAQAEQDGLREELRTCRGELSGLSLSYNQVCLPPQW